MPAIGDIVAVTIDTGRVVPAVITLVNSGNNVNLVAFLDVAADWPNGSPSAHPAQLWTSIDKGTAVGQWTDL